MSGNEILLNMTNCKYFRHGELVNAVYELSKRIQLPENKGIECNWNEHPYLGESLKLMNKKLMIFNVNIIFILS